MLETKTPVKAGVKAPVDQVAREEMGKVVAGKSASRSFQASGLKETGVSENGAKLSAKVQASSPRPVVEKKPTSSTPEPMLETKTPVKAGVKAPVDQVAREEMGKVVAGKSASRSFQASGLKETESSESGAKLSEKAQESSPRIRIDKKETSATPEPMPGTKTPAKGGVKAPVSELSGAENGKVVVGKTESGSFQVSGLKETEATESGAKLSEKAQESSPRIRIDKKEASATPELSSNATKTAGNILSGSGESSSAGKENPLFSDSFRVIRSGVGEVNVTEKGEKGQKDRLTDLEQTLGRPPALGIGNAIFKIQHRTTRRSG